MNIKTNDLISRASAGASQKAAEEKAYAQVEESKTLPGKIADFQVTSDQTELHDEESFIRNYSQISRMHVESHAGWTVANNLQTTLAYRRKGMKVVSVREGDTLARSKTDMSSEIFTEALMGDSFSIEEPSLIIEGRLVGTVSNVFELRAMWNKGIRLKKTQTYKDSDQKEKDRVAAKQQEIIRLLNEKCLPMWPFELEHGFHPELCKPECMTWQEYENAKKRGFAFHATS